ncbi:MAG: response regulator transcription factor [Oscillospiraceae bacterium]|nr:response regulator transcription factor [Oscillospiraceae bacterium]
MKILIVEDERNLAEAIAAVLAKSNYSVDLAFDGEYGLDCALSGIYDIIVLDIMLPKIDGLSVLAQLRQQNILTPVLMLTALGEVRDRVTGLNIGADDYMPKPFHMDELIARLNALLRRTAELSVDGIIEYGSLRFNPHTLWLSCAGVETNLTLKESRLLELFIKNRNTLVSKDYIIEKLWSYDADISDSHVESQVSLLRKKLLLVGSDIKIKVIRRMGYRIDASKELKSGV